MAKFKKSNFAKTVSLILTLVLILSTFVGCGGKEEPETTAENTTQQTTKAPEVIRNPLTGVAGYDKSLLKNRPVLVSVENHPDARPQWGLTSSDIVWEMVAEGGITRMLLMYADVSRLPDKLGPTRSARHYFVDIAEGFDAIFVHFGYSPYAKSQINNHGVDNINGLTDGGYFFRDRSRGVASEHTAYTTKEAITKAVADKDYRTTLEDGYENPFKFSSKARKLADGECTDLTVSFSSGYTYTYTYDADKNVYLSSLNGNKFVGSDGTQQNFENIIVCYTTISSMNDAKNRVTFDLSDGHGTYISNGTYESITWKKGDSADMMKFYDKDGNELKLNTGRTYIALVGKDRESQTVISAN